MSDADRRDDALALGELSIARAWNVKGDAADRAFLSQASRLLDIALPSTAMTTTRNDDALAMWLGPASWLVLSDASADTRDFDAARKALNDAGGALFDVSASHVAWMIGGAVASRVLNRLCPLDLHPSAFPPGAAKQSLLGHIHALYYRPHDAPAFVVIVARSFSGDAARELREAAQSEGYRTVETRAIIAATSQR
ncbi:MAG TPA: sarcosine oxidase subunit gamma family protein [Casimicrobiaceae bacterium]|nr:sarcosine oxidase subunit gamma family protein [Casimicrobiaceae bacterium]